MKNQKELIILGRFHFVFGGLLLYSLGYLLSMSSGISFSLDCFFWGYAILFFAHLSVSYSNDFFDTKGDEISKPTLFSGGSGILVKHPELKGTARKIALALIVLSFISAAGFYPSSRSKNRNYRLPDFRWIGYDGLVIFVIEFSIQLHRFSPKTFS